MMRLLRILRYTIERMDIPILDPAGTNLLGLILAFAAFLPLGILMKQYGARIEGLLNFIGGAIVFGGDWFYRRKLDALFETAQGGRMFYLPSWIWGVMWMVSGIIIFAIELIKGGSHA